MAHVDDHTLHAGEPAVAAWRRAVEVLLASAIHRLRPPDANTAEDIHAVRVAIKHTRALLRMIRPALPERIYLAEDDHLKAAAQQLSKLRDADVGRDLLRDLSTKARGRNEKRAFASVRASYESASAGRRSQNRERARRAVIGALESSRADLRVVPVEAAEWVAIGPGAEAIYRSCRRRMHKALRSGDDRAFHRWRTRLKNLLHVLQFLAPIQPKKLGKLAKKLTRLHQLIGADHDLIVLTTTLCEQTKETSDTASVSVVLRRVKRERANLRKKVRHLAVATLEEKPGHFLRRLGRRWMKWRSQGGAGLGRAH